MTTEQYIRANLLTLAFREAKHYGGMDNMLAVMFVVRNRVHAGWQGGDWMMVISDHYKFKAEPKLRSMKAGFPDLRDPVIRELLPIVDDIQAGIMPDHITDGALFYADLNNVKSAWFKRNILERLGDHARVACVGPVNFFR